MDSNTIKIAQSSYVALVKDTEKIVHVPWATGLGELLLKTVIGEEDVSLKVFI